MTLVLFAILAVVVVVAVGACVRRKLYQGAADKEQVQSNRRITDVIRGDAWEK